MPVERLEVQISLRNLLLALVIVIVPLSIMGLAFTEHSGKSLDNTIGNNFKALAQMYSTDVSAYVRDRVSDVNAIGADSTVVAALMATHRAANQNTNAKPSGKTATNPAVNELLRQRSNLDPRFVSVTVTDENGSVIASTQRVPKASFAQDEAWQGAYNKGQGAVKISGILEDEMTKSEYLNIAVPVGDPASGNLIGVLSADVTVTPLLQRFQQDPIGNGARAMLVDDTGLIVSGRNADVFSRLKSGEFDSVRDSIGTGQGRASGWQLAGVGNRSYLVGYAATGLKQNFENLGWTVLVSQEERQATASVRSLQRFAILMVVFSLLMLTLLCVYYSLHRTQKFNDMEDLLPSRSATTAGSF